MDQNFKLRVDTTVVETFQRTREKELSLTRRAQSGNICASDMRAVDTNVLVRLLVRDDAEQVRAAEDFTSKSAWVSHLVLAETICVLDAVYDRTAEQIAAGIEMLLNHKDLTVQDADVASLALKLFRKYPALGFSDCLMLEIARKSGHLPVGTFERDLARLDGVVRIPH